MPPTFTVGDERFFVCAATGQLIKAGVLLSDVYPKKVFSTWGAVLAVAAQTVGEDKADEHEDYIMVRKLVSDLSGIAQDALRRPAPLAGLKINDPESLAAWRATDCTTATLTGFVTVTELEAAEKQRRELARAKAKAAPAKQVNPVVYLFPASDDQAITQQMGGVAGNPTDLTVQEWADLVNARYGQDAGVHATADDAALVFTRGSAGQPNRRVQELLGLACQGNARVLVRKNGSSHRDIKKHLSEQLKAQKDLQEKERSKSDGDAPPKKPRLGSAGKKKLVKSG